MAEFKNGDRVKVSFEGVVTAVCGGGTGYVYVGFEQREIAFNPAAITIIPPPHEYKPGDKVKFKDGTVGEVYADHANTARKGFVCVKFQRPADAFNSYIRVPASEIELYTEPTPPAGAMPPYWIDVEEDGTGTFVGRVYDTATFKIAHKTSHVYPRIHAVLMSLEWIRSQGAKS